jgi:hypothetical protein
MVASSAVTLFAFAVQWAEDPYGENAWVWVPLGLVAAFVIAGVGLATRTKTRGLGAGLVIGALISLGVVFLFYLCLIWQMGA